MKLYNANFSPNCLRVRAVIFEIGANVEIVEVDVFKGGTQTPEYLAINPNGKVPAFVDGDLRLFESRAINAYLASLDPSRRLYPEDLKKRAVVDQWSYWQAIHLGPSSQRLSFEKVLKERFGRGKPDETIVANETKETTKLLGVFNHGLDGRDWIAGDLSIADFALASTLTRRQEAGIDLGGFPKVAKWIDRLESRDSWQKAVAAMGR
jgi:glutathione S-transferase